MSDILYPETGVAAEEPSKCSFGMAVPRNPYPITTWREVLIHAAAKLERDGWLQGSYCATDDEDRPIGPVCAVGAINMVLGRQPMTTTGYAGAKNQPLFEEAYIHFAKFIGCDDEELMEFDDTIQNWNDNSETIKEQVIAAMLEAAAAP